MYGPNQSIPLVGAVDYGQTLPEDLAVSFTSNVDGDLGTSTPSSCWSRSSPDVVTAVWKHPRSAMTASMTAPMTAVFPTVPTSPQPAETAFAKSPLRSATTA